jgi:hypothetical protein
MHRILNKESGRCGVFFRFTFFSAAPFFSYFFFVPGVQHSSTAAQQWPRKKQRTQTQNTENQANTDEIEKMALAVTSDQVRALLDYVHRAHVATCIDRKTPTTVVDTYRVAFWELWCNQHAARNDATLVIGLQCIIDTIHMPSGNQGLLTYMAGIYDMVMRRVNSEVSRARGAYDRATAAMFTQLMLVPMQDEVQQAFYRLGEWLAQQTSGMAHVIAQMGAYATRGSPYGDQGYPPARMAMPPQMQPSYAPYQTEPLPPPLPPFPVPQGGAVTQSPSFVSSALPLPPHMNANNIKSPADSKRTSAGKKRAVPNGDNSSDGSDAATDQGLQNLVNSARIKPRPDVLDDARRQAADDNANKASYALA